MENCFYLVSHMVILVVILRPSFIFGINFACRSIDLRNRLGALPTTMEEESDEEEGQRNNEIPKTYQDLLATVTKKLQKQKRNHGKHDK